MHRITRTDHARHLLVEERREGRRLTVQLRRVVRVVDGDREELARARHRRQEAQRADVVRRVRLRCSPLELGTMLHGRRDQIVTQPGHGRRHVDDHFVDEDAETALPALMLEAHEVHG
jgi:hypothetical protein